MYPSQAENLNDLFDHREIKGKRVFIVDDHQKAFAAWALIRRERQDPPILISLDHHTDTLEAFLHAAAMEHPYDDDEMEARRAELMKLLGWSDEAVLASVAKLKHDEQIQAAAACGIVRASFSIQLSDMSGWPSVEENAFSEQLAAAWPNTVPEPRRPFTYEPPPNNVFVVGHECFIGCKGRPHTDECLSPHYSQVLESIYLNDQLDRAKEMASCIGIKGSIDSVAYVLDIDLDIFHTRASIEPKDTATLYRLIKGALAITIATEAECVDELWLKTEETRLSANNLLERLLAHINSALN